MLVLNRHPDAGPGSQIMIGDNIVITLVECRKTGRCTIGIEAPKDVVVLRREIWDKIQREAKP